MRSHIFLFGSLPRRRPPEFTAILMFEFWREATATSVPGLLCQSGRRRSENVTILSSLLRREMKAKCLVNHSTRQCLAKKLGSQKISTKLVLHSVLLLKLSRD